MSACAPRPSGHYPHELMRRKSSLQRLLSEARSGLARAELDVRLQPDEPDEHPPAEVLAARVVRERAELVRLEAELAQVTAELGARP